MDVMDKLIKCLDQISLADTLPEIIRPKKLLYPGYYDCEFRSLRDAVHYFTKNGYNPEYRVIDLIRYNICYRDYLRSHGIETLVKRLIADAPELADDKKSIQSILTWYRKDGKHLASYDVQCYNIKDTITVLGCEFKGLADVKAHVNACGRIGCCNFSFNDCKPQKSMDDLYVSELYATYPIFDSYDLGDDRTYQNYVFTREPLGNERLSQVLSIRSAGNHCLVHESIPEHLLPILYYQGDGNYMILATKK